MLDFKYKSSSDLSHLDLARKPDLSSVFWPWKFDESEDALFIQYSDIFTYLRSDRKKIALTISQPHHPFTQEKTLPAFKIIVKKALHLSFW